MQISAGPGAMPPPGAKDGPKVDKDGKPIKGGPPPEEQSFFKRYVRLFRRFLIKALSPCAPRQDTAG